MHRKWPLAAGAALLAAAGAAGYGWWWREQHKPVPAQTQVKRPVPPETEVSLPGKIQAKNVVDVGAPIDGILDQYLVDVGEEGLEVEVLDAIKNTGLAAAAKTARSTAEKARDLV